MSNRIRERLLRRARQQLGGTWVKDAYLASWHGFHGAERAIRRLAGSDRLCCPRLQVYGRKVHSQNDEDGILEYLFSRIPPRESFFVEIGVGPPWRGGALQDVTKTGLECNCRLLAERGWRGLFLDGESYPASLGVTQGFVTAENINELLVDNGVPEDFDLFSLDIDSNDYWVWKALKYQPSVVIMEYNAAIAAAESKTIPYDPEFNWSAHGRTAYYGASLLALTRLGEQKGYTLVYANGVNAFFVLSSLVPNRGDFVYERIYKYKDCHAELRGDEVWQEV